MDQSSVSGNSNIEKMRDQLRQRYLLFLEDFIDQGMNKNPEFDEKYLDLRRLLLGEIKPTFILLSAAEAKLNQIMQFVLTQRRNQEDINRLNTQSIIELIETDEDNEREAKEESSDDEIVYRCPSPICVLDMKKKKEEEVVSLNSESDCEVVERNPEDSIIQIGDSTDEEETLDSPRSPPPRGECRDSPRSPAARRDSSISPPPRGEYRDSPRSPAARSDRSISPPTRREDINSRRSLLIGDKDIDSPQSPPYYRNGYFDSPASPDRRQQFDRQSSSSSREEYRGNWSPAGPGVKDRHKSKSLSPPFHNHRSPSPVSVVPEKSSEKLPAPAKQSDQNSNHIVTPKPTHENIPTFTADQISDALPAHDEDEILQEIEKAKEPPRPKPTMPSRRKSVGDIESLKTYKLKNTPFLKPASSYAKPKNTSNGARKTFSVKETKPVEKPKVYDPLAEVIAVSKVKERLYSQKYLDPNNKVKLAAAGKLPLIALKDTSNENNDESGSSPDGGKRISIKEKLFNRKPKNVDDNQEKEVKDLESTDKKKTSPKQDKKKTSSAQDKLQNYQEKLKHQKRYRYNDFIIRRSHDSDSDSETGERIQKKPRKSHKKSSSKFQGRSDNENESSVKESPDRKKKSSKRDKSDNRNSKESKDRKKRHNYSSKSQSSDSDSEIEDKIQKKNRKSHKKSSASKTTEKNDSKSSIEASPTHSKNDETLKKNPKKLTMKSLESESNDSIPIVRKRGRPSKKLDSSSEISEKSASVSRETTTTSNRNDSSLDAPISPQNEVASTSKSLDSIKDCLSVLQTICGAEKFNSLLEDFKNKKQNDKIENKENEEIAENERDAQKSPASDIEQIMEEIHNGPAETCKIRDVEVPKKNKNSVKKQESGKTTEKAKKRGRPKKSDHLQVQSSYETFSRNQSNFTYEEDNSKQNPSNGSEILSEESFVHSEVSHSTYVHDNDNDPENLLEPLEIKVKRGRNRRKSVYESDDEVPLTKRRKRDERATRGSEKRDAEINSVLLNNFEVKTEPIEEGAPQN